MSREVFIQPYKGNFSWKNSRYYRIVDAKSGKVIESGFDSWESAREWVRRHNAKLPRATRGVKRNPAKKTLASQERFKNAAALISTAARISRDYDADLRTQLEKWGDHGPHVSGAGRDHFPESVKERLRAKARLVGKRLDMARKALPKGTRMSTYRKLRDEVYAREGRGFYG